MERKLFFFQCLRLLLLVFGLKSSHQLFNQWRGKPKPIPPCTRDSPRAFRKLQVIAKKIECLMALFAPVVLGRSMFVFRQLFENHSNNYTIIEQSKILLSETFHKLTKLHKITLSKEKTLFKLPESEKVRLWKALKWLQIL